MKKLKPLVFLSVILFVACIFFFVTWHFFFRTNQTRWPQKIESSYEKMKEGNYSGASESFREIIASEPKKQAAYIGLGLSLFYQKDYTGAITAYKKALLLDSNDPIVYANMGDVLFSQRKWNEAQGWYEKAMNLGLKHPRIFNNLGMALFSTGNPVRAMFFLKEATHLEKKSKYYENLGMVQMDTQNFLEARNAYAEAAKLDPSNQQVILRLGYAEFMSGNQQDGIETVKKILERDPHNSEALENLGVFYLTLKKYTDALGYFNQSSADLKNDPIHYSNMSLAYLGENDLPRAKQALETAIRLDPENFQYQERLKELLKKQ